MTQARAQLVTADTPGTYHCIQRCVRRAFLCGVDRYAGRNYEHRKTWVEDRLAHVAGCFAACIHAYAVMSNHLHVVVHLDPIATQHWSELEVAERWVRLFPPREASAAAYALKVRRVLADPERLAVLRQRLGSLSWLMKCLAEPIARRANAEDGCKGRFWEGRFKTQRLCDERAVLAAMVYVDLNPVRAGLTDRLEASHHTSVMARLPPDAEMALAQARSLPKPPLARPPPTRQTARKGRLNFLYLGRPAKFEQWRKDARHRSPASAPLALHNQQWTVGDTGNEVALVNPYRLSKRLDRVQTRH